LTSDNVSKAQQAAKKAADEEACGGRRIPSGTQARNTTNGWIWALVSIDMMRGCVIRDVITFPLLRPE
jgi:hypothetical protein